MPKPFEQLLVWHDPVPRPGPENMAVDEVLLKTIGDTPVLRIYEWEGEWVSLGYFQELAAAQALFEGEDVQFVRRMTGGGVVDHRHDQTYSLIIPRGHPLAEARGVESYRIIHEAVAHALTASGTPARLVAEDGAGKSLACFEKPVAWDVVGDDGRKLAGAGQKRTKTGLLHQGSVLGGQDLEGELAKVLAATSQGWSPPPAWRSQAKALVPKRYNSSAWLERR